MNDNSPRRLRRYLDGILACLGVVGKIGLRVTSLVGILLQAYGALYFYIFVGRPGRASFADSLFLAFPFVYLAFSFYATIGLKRRRNLIIAATLLNSALVIEDILSTTVGVGWEPSLVFMALWTFLCIGRLRNTKIAREKHKEKAVELKS